jgi:hypothetical protein
MSLPLPPAADDQVLVRYLVGALAGEETERLDELSVVDDDLAARLRGVENDLVDAYVRGELSGETLEGFESTYLLSSHGRGKIRFATALAARTPAAQAIAPAKPVVPAWALALAASLLIAIIGYPIVERAGLPDRRKPATPPTSPPQPDRRAPVAASVLSFALAPAGQGDASSITIPPATRAVDFRLSLTSHDFPRYQATLRDPQTHRILWRSDPFQAVGSAGTVVVPSVAATLLKPQGYEIELTGISATGVAQLLATYPFRVNP